MTTTETPSPGGEVTPQMKLQIMSTEHWSLLASRSLAWNESFTRAGTYLSTLSFAVVALALVGQASGFDETFRLFALVVLPIVLFVGIATSLRMASANYHDVLCVIGMNRIRAGYLELAPELERFLVMGATDDFDGITRTMAIVPGRHVAVNLMSASPTLVALLNAAVAGALGALVALQLWGSIGVGVAAGAAAFVFVGLVQFEVDRRQVRGLITSHRPLFPARDA